MHYNLRKSDIITKIIEKYRKNLDYIRLIQDELQHKHGLLISDDAKVSFTSENGKAHVSTCLDFVLS
jgi:hypothetical protein